MNLCMIFYHCNMKVFNIFSDKSDHLTNLNGTKSNFE